MSWKWSQQSRNKKSRTYTKFQPNWSNYGRDTANFIGFSTVRKWRYEVTRSWNCVSRVQSDLVHCRNLSETTLHFVMGAQTFVTAVRPPLPPPASQDSRSRSSLIEDRERESATLSESRGAAPWPLGVRLRWGLHQQTSFQYRPFSYMSITYCSYHER